MWRIKASIYILWWIIKLMPMNDYPEWMTRKIVIRTAWESWKSQAIFDKAKGKTFKDLNQYLKKNGNN